MNEASSAGEDPDSAWGVAFVGALAYRFVDLMPLLQENLDSTDGEVIAYSMMGQVSSWLVEHLDTAPDAVQSVLDWLESEYAGGNDYVQTLIAVGAIEMLPSPQEPGGQIRELLGPHLREFYALVYGPR